MSDAFNTSGRRFDPCRATTVIAGQLRFAGLTTGTADPRWAKNGPTGFAPPVSVSALGATPRVSGTAVCIFTSVKPSDPSGGFACFGSPEAMHTGRLSSSRPIQQRLVCIEAGQTFSIQRVKVLKPQISSIHCRFTRGRSLVRSQPGPSQVLAGKAVGRRTFVILVVGRAARYRPYRATYRHLKSGTSFGLEWVPVTALGLGRPAWVARALSGW